MRFRLTQHAIERYRDRVKPALTIGIAAQELQLLMEVAAVLTDPPEWLTSFEGEADRYAELSDGIYAAITPKGAVLTILVNRCLSDDARAERNKRKAEQRHRRRFKGPADQGRPPLSRIEDEEWPV